MNANKISTCERTSKRNWFQSLLVLFIITGFVPVNALCEPIIYHFDGIASGSLDDEPLAHVGIHLLAQSDTAAVIWNDYAWLNYPSTVEISIDGFGSGVLTDTISVFDNPDVFGGTVGLTSMNVGDIIQIHGETIGSAFFSSYDLRSPTAVFGGYANPSISDWVGVGTSMGVLTLTDMQHTTFQAELIPEPGSVSLLFVNAMILIARGFRIGCRIEPIGATNRGRA